jgi:DNA polymerase-3 subunit epsilon
MAMYKELLWIFTQLPDDYTVLDTETTGLPDENGPPDIVTLGLTVVINRAIA